MSIDRQAKKNELQEALSAFDVYQIAEVFKLPPVAPTKSPNNSRKPAPLSLKDHGLDWSATLNHFCNAADAALQGDAKRSYECQSSCHSSFHSVFSSSSGNWLVPTLHTIVKCTKDAAIAADKEAQKSQDNKAGKDSNANLQKATSLLQESYSKTSNDRKEFVPGSEFSEEGSKKAGVLQIVNTLFSIYFRLNTLRLCKNLVRPIESRKLHEQARMSEMVTYRYYVGRLFLFEDQYELAEENLDYALQHCHKNSVHNKRCILRYLVPVKLFRGRLPSKMLLEKYNLHEFAGLVEGVRTGDLRTFQDALVKYQDVFIHRGTYLLLEKLKTICYRNLFKRIYIVMDKHQISLNYVAKSLKWLGMPIDLDEVECILANLIYRKFIRGYLSHSKRVLVLSKKDPFPIESITGVSQ